MKTKLMLFIIILSNNLFCQNPKFKNLFTEEDRQALIGNIRFALGFSSDVKFSYSTTEIFSSKIVGESPASFKDIERQKKLLKGKDTDASIFLEISGLYARLNQNIEAEKYRNKAIDIAENLIEQYPDSVDPYLFLAAVYLGALKPEKVIYYNKKAASLKPGFVEPLMSNAAIFLMYMQVDSAEQIIQHILKNYPNDHRIYTLIPMIYITTFFKKINTDADFFVNSQVDSILSTPLLDEIYLNNKSEYDVEYIYRTARQILISSYTGIINITDTTFDSDNVRFKIPPQISNEMHINKEFFLECLKNKDKKYHFYANKSLGSIYLLNNETKKAITYLRKTIDLKPVSNCSTTSNTNEDYYNLLQAYFIIKDTASYEKILLEKIKLQPTIDPYSRDYTNMGMLYCYKNKINIARQYFQKAKDIDDNYLAFTEAGDKSTALVGLGLCDFTENNIEGAMNYVNMAFKQDRNQWEQYVLYAAILIQQRDVINAYETLKTLKRNHDRVWIQKDLIDYFFEFK